MSNAIANEVRTNGRYGFRPVGGLIRPEAHYQWDVIHGLPVAMEYAYGSLRAEDGTYFWPIRGAYQERARYLHISEAAKGQDFIYAPEGQRAYGGPIEHGQRDGWWGVWMPDGTSLLKTNGPEFRWTDGEWVDVQGKLTGDAWQFFVPDAEEPMVYTSRLFRGTGTIKGKKVKGLFFHDSMHMPPGMNFIESSYLKVLEAAWVAFATEYEDGTIHAGHLVYGTQGFVHMIIRRSDGPPIVARELRVQVEFDGGDPEYPKRVTYEGGGETWIWEALPTGGRCPVRTDLIEGHRWIQGWVHREGEKRRPICTEALMETYNGRLDDVRVR